jgi:large subunit ribosomal protein L21
MSYAIIKSGSHQFRVQKGLVLDVQKIEGNPGDQITIDEVYQLSVDGQSFIGQPVVQGARVLCELVKHKRAPKVMIMKLRRRKNSRRRNGHRQHLTVLKVLDISYQPS